MYIPRYIENVIQNVSKTFKVLYVSGPRQVGKTTTLLQMAKQHQRNYVTLDDIADRELAQNDPEFFLQKFKTPLLIDEVQYAPQLFPYIKIRVDQTQTKGSYWLTGSQQFRVMKNVHESLVGRVGIIQLLGLSSAELTGKMQQPAPFLPTQLPGTSVNPELDKIDKVFKYITIGFFPALWQTDPPDKSIFYNSYQQTYLDRDLQDIFGITKISQFNTFLRLCAARTGQQLNYSDLARDAGIAVSTAREWISILESTMQIYLLRPYYHNFSKRLVKAPKLYFLDTGLAAHLTKWKDAATVQSGAMAGSFFETYVITELIKSYIFRGVEPPLYYFRDKESHEVDVLIEDGQKLYPVEIKLASRVQSDDVASILYLQKKIHTMSAGGVICLAPKRYAITRDIEAIPVGEIQ